MDKDSSTRKRKKSIEDSVRNVKRSMKNGSGMFSGPTWWDSTFTSPNVILHPDTDVSVYPNPLVNGQTALKRIQNKPWVLPTGAGPFDYWTLKWLSLAGDATAIILTIKLISDCKKSDLCRIWWRSEQKVLIIFMSIFHYQ